ncbi:MAG: filamentous hemagglutinin N-terminal domain-containing protein, partial [Candidatus Omnitrophota bacterium]
MAFDRSVANTFNINIASQNAIVEWSQFSIASGYSVNFNFNIVQPSSGSILNYVTGSGISAINGAMNSNGNVMLVNPNGIAFGETARVNVASLIASTLKIDYENFANPVNGQYHFYKDGKAKGFITNAGRIAAQPGGYIALLSQAVENSGTLAVTSIEAKIGSIFLASGERMTVSMDDQSLISVAVEEGVREEIFGPDGKRMDSGIKNSGTITAAGGRITLTAKTLNKVFDHAINNTGVIEAKSWAKHDGIIELLAEGAPIRNAGRIEATEVKAHVTGSDFVNEGDIVAPKIEIRAPEGQIVNKRQIAAPGSPEKPDGGKIVIEALSILHQGIISANAYENGTGGDIVIESQKSTILDTESRTEARAATLVGNGGRIRINSKGGNTTVYKGAVVDVSAGNLAGNGGVIDVSAFDQLGFFGILSGRAPPGYKQGSAILDPTDASIGLGTSESPATFNINTTVWATRNITIDGNITIADGFTLYLFADHNSATAGDWHDGTGTITRSGNYTITGTSASLDLKAGSGIGTSGTRIKTNVATLSAENSTSNDIYIEQGTTDLTLSSVENAANGKVIDLDADGDLLIGWVACDNVVLNASGSIDGLGTQTNDDGDLMNIEADDLDLTAGEDIGANYPLFISANTFSIYANNGNIGAETSTKMGFLYDMKGDSLDLDGAEVSVVGNDYSVTMTKDGYFELKSVNLSQPVIIKVTKDGYQTYYSFKSSTRAENSVYLFTSAQYTGLMGLLEAFLDANGQDEMDPDKGLMMGVTLDSTGEDVLYGPGITATLEDGNGDPISGITTVYFNPDDDVPTFYLTSQATTYAFIIINVPTGQDYTLSAEKTGSEFKTYQVQAFTDGLAMGFVKSTDDSGLRIAIYSGTTTDTDSDGLPDSLETTLGTNPALADTDDDNLSDYEEYLKYRTNPNSDDSDSDGTNDDDWDERREYVYTINVQGKTLLRADIDAMNDFFQDAVSLGTFTYNGVTGLYYDVILYPDAVQLVIPQNYPASYSSDLAPYVASSLTVTLSPEMKAKVQEIVGRIPAGDRTDLNVVDTLLKWLKENSLDVLSLGGGYSPSMLFEITATEEGFTLLRQNDGNAFRTAYGEQTFERYEIFSDQQFRSGYHGSCGSTTELLTGLLRAAGIPTRMANAIPLFPYQSSQATPEEFYQDMVDALNDPDLKALLTDYLNGDLSEVMNHFTPEAYINGQWIRMDQSGPDDAGIGPLLNGMPNIKLLSMADYDEYDMAGNEGSLNGSGPDWGDIEIRPLYHTLSLTDQNAVHSPSAALPSKETASYNSPGDDVLEAPVFLQPGVIIAAAGSSLAASIDHLQAKDICAVVAGANRNLAISDFSLSGTENQAYLESATSGISVADIDVYSLELYAGDDVSLTGDIEELYGTVLIDLGNPLPLPEDAVRTFAVTDSSELYVDYLWHNDGEIQISTGSQPLNADEIITYRDGNVSLTSEGASSTIENITSAGDLILSKTTTSATYTVGAHTIDVGGALEIGSGVTLTCSGATEINVREDWINSGTFNAGTSTVTFDGTAAGEQIKANGATSPFYHIAFTGSGGEWTLQDMMKVTGRFVVSNGKFISGAHTVTVQGASALYQDSDIDAGNTTWTDGTLILLSDTNQSLPDDETYNNIELGRDAGSGTTDYTIGSDSAIDGDGTIDNDARVVMTVNAAGVNKVYDGDKTAEVTLSFAGANLFDSYDVSPDDYTAEFANENAGDGKAVTVTDITLGGANADRFVLSSDEAATTANIAKHSANIDGTRVYDASANVSSSIFTLSGLVGTETLTLTGTGTVASAHVGNDKAVTLSTLQLNNGTGLAANYDLTAGTATVDITAKPITASGITASNKVYNTTTAAA